MNKFVRPREYYRRSLKALYKKVVPKGSRVILIKKPSDKIPKSTDYVVVDDLLGNIDDIQSLLMKIHSKSKKKIRVLLVYYNHVWEPVLKLATLLRLRERKKEQNWLDGKDIENLLNISGFEVITTQRRMLVPIYIPFLSSLLNNWIAHLPLINSLCLTTYIIARPDPEKISAYSTTIVVPAQNEEGNIAKIIPSLPNLGKQVEVIFVEGHSKDNTWGAIRKELDKKRRKGLVVKTFRQRGKGKANAVDLGFKKATGDILMIYDADRTVEAKDLEKFYDALSNGKGEFINGSRLVYPMEKEAMRTLNKLGNKFFSLAFTWILGQRFKDTLCGTKALFKKDYEKMREYKTFFGVGKDPFGDFKLIFGAIKLNLKVVEIPVRYKERRYGSTNISRAKHGLMLLKMTWVAFRNFKVWGD